MSCSLEAQIPNRSRFCFESDVLNPSQPTLAEAFASNSAVLIVTDNQADLHQYFASQQKRGWIRDFRILHFSQDDLQDPWQTCLRIIQAGIDLQLRRSDAYVAYAGTELTTLTALAAAMYRRTIRFVQIQDDIDGVLYCLRNQGLSQVRWHGYHSQLKAMCTIGLTHLNTLNLVDEVSLSRSLQLASAVNNIELLKLALVSDANLFRELQLSNSTVANSDLSEAIIQSLKAFSQKVFPGNTSPLEFGEPFGDLLASGLTPAEAQACGIMLATLFSQAIALLSSEVVQQVWVLLNHAGFEDCLTQLISHENELAVKFKVLSTRSEDTSFVLIDRIGSIQLVQSQEVFSDINIQRVIDSLKACQGWQWEVVDLVEVPQNNHQTNRNRAASRREGRKGRIDAAAASRRVGRRVLESCWISNISSSELVQYSVTLVPSVLDPANSSLSACFRKGQRILAVVDAYDGHQAKALQAYLDRQLELGEIAGYKLHIAHFTSSQKNMDAVLEIIEQASLLQLASDDLMVVMGGGTLTDIVGFAAALYEGGITYIRIPTTFVGLIDAGVGLKVGVNFKGKKNFLGTYYPSTQCLCDKSFLQTLPIEEIRCGLSEAIKIALVKDASLFALIEEHYPLVLARSQEPVIDKILMRAIALMLEELESNPYELSARRLPDFGHEFGHSLESLTHHQLRHGEAVAIGMALSCHIAWSAGLLKRSVLERILKLLLEVGLPIYHLACQSEVLWQRLFEDVITHKMGRLHLVVPTDIGKGAFIDDITDINLTMLQQACTELKSFSLQSKNHLLALEVTPSQGIKTLNKSKQPLIMQSLKCQEERR
ncbi:3-dehydroquinate synthase family protein [Nostoc sp.]|uniref:3-dehydroquinate synthase family protein n=1 Tax=Nostoc sp. TaxID=1180 RepID=UPI002FFBB732